ncbi:hypothetical protein [Bradyrhizobium oligotrophicum]|nr:hypothetical protein [Bradyrhizobium oligotrophicum]
MISVKKKEEYFSEAGWREDALEAAREMSFLARAVRTAQGGLETSGRPK